jgi:arabinose-5-phosphate isomerase
MEDNILSDHLNQLNILKNIDLKKLDSLVNLICNCNGNIFFCGVGKNMTVANHMADILKSIGIRAFYFSTINSSHGDLGVLNKNDIVIYLSKSGNTLELINLAKHIQERKIETILISSNICSELHNYVDFNLFIPCENELTHMIPSTSIISFIFIFNIIVKKIVNNKNINIKNYGKNHPGGNIGYVLNTSVRDIMKTDSLPIIESNITLKETLFIMTKFKQSFILYVENEILIGILTDGDLRRSLNNNNNFNIKIKELINHNFKFVFEDDLISKIILEFRNSPYLNSCIPVVNSNQNLKGIINNNILINYK